jgi:hypothetical protein
VNELIHKTGLCGSQPIVRQHLGRGPERADFTRGEQLPQTQQGDS